MACDNVHEHLLHGVATMTRDIEVSAIVPVFRGRNTLKPLVERLDTVLAQCASGHEIILVDDASQDDSWDVIKSIQRAKPECVTAIQLMRNFGQHNALMCGFRQASGRFLITLDEDLQHPPEEIPKLLTRLRNTDADIVYGIPERRQHERWRNYGSKLVTRFFQMAFRTHIQPSAFRGIRRETVDAVLAYTLNYTFIDGLLAWNTQRFEQVTVEHLARASGRSGYSFGKLVVLALNLFTNFSLFPLQLVSVMGIISSVTGLSTGVYYLAQYSRGAIQVPGYASTITAILVLGGLQMLSLGVIGEYLGRLHLNVNRKPQYTIRSLLERNGRRVVGGLSDGPNNAESIGM